MNQDKKGRSSPTPRERVRAMSDQDVTARYSEETRKLKNLNRFGRHSAQFLGYPSTLMMNLCKRELERRHLPVPPIHPDEGQGQGGNPA